MAQQTRLEARLAPRRNDGFIASVAKFTQIAYGFDFESADVSLRLREVVIYFSCSVGWLARDVSF